FYRTGPEALEQDAGANLHAVLKAQIHEHLSQRSALGRISFAIIASHDPELLVQKTHRILHEADLVLYAPNTPPAVLELARREADFGALPSDAQPLIDAAMRGQHVICLCREAPDPRLIAACHHAGL